MSTTVPCFNVIDLDELEGICKKNINNPKFGYLNINHIRNKVVDLRCILKDIEFTYLAIAETKIDDSFPSTQFQINGYVCPKEFRKDRTGNVGGMLIYIKKGTPCKRLKKFECTEIETIVTEIRVGNQKWCIVSIYRNEDVTADVFFNNLSKSLDMILDEYENLVIIGDININSLKKRRNFDKSKFDKLKVFCETYDLSNLIKVPTCFQSNESTSIDVILTNKNRSFINSRSVANALSDHHSLVCTMLRKTIKKLRPVRMKYRCFKNFVEDNFLVYLKNRFQRLDFTKPKNDLKKFLNEFENIADKHAPIKTKIIRGNDAPFMTAELRKEIRLRSKLCNAARKLKSTAAKLALRKQRNKCTHIRRQAQKSYFENISNGTKNVKFWKTVGPYMNDKGSHGHDDYILEENEELIKEPSPIANIFNSYYTNIVEQTTGKPPVEIPIPENGDLIDSILDYYKGHSSIQRIQNMGIKEMFEIPLAGEDDIQIIIAKLNTTKASGLDNISARLIKSSAKVISKPLTHILNHCIKKGFFPDLMKIAKITPLYKKGSRLEK